MFSHRFFLHEPTFNAVLDEARYPQQAAPRFVHMARFAHDLLGWFEAQPALESVKLSSVALPEIEKSPVSVRIRHHFTLVGVNGTVPDAEDYALEHLPYSLMGAGVFQLSRSDEAVQKFLALATDAPQEYQALVYGLALRIDAAFDLLFISHDVGLRTAGG
jgi:hypothetical protein